MDAADGVRWIGAVLEAASSSYNGYVDEHEYFEGSRRTVNMRRGSLFLQLNETRLREKVWDNVTYWYRLCELFDLTEGRVVTFIVNVRDQWPGGLVRL